MSRAAFVSILIPTYNREDLVGRAISSVLAQTYADYELVVVDDGSTDDTDEVVRRFSDPRIRYLKMRRNRGVLAARNVGLSEARGGWIGLLDSDNEFYPDALETLVGTLQKLEREGTPVGTIIGNCSNSRNGALTGKGVAENRFVTYEEFLGGSIHGEFCGLFSSQVLGGLRFNEQLSGFESLIWLDLYRRSATYYVHRPLAVYHTEYSDSITTFDSLLRNAEKMILGYDSLLKTYGEDLLRISRRRYAYYQTRRAFFEVMQGRRRKAIADLVRSLGRSPSFEAFGLLVAALCFPQSMIAWFGRKAAAWSRGQA